jgi:hypothetical protein
MAERQKLSITTSGYKAEGETGCISETSHNGCMISILEESSL